jgi:hypothetical protein
MKKSVGSIVVDERGNVVLLTAIDVVEDTGFGRISMFDSGLILRGSKPLFSRGSIKSGEGLRIIGHIKELVTLLEQTGADLTTPAERPLASLTPAERLERIETLLGRGEAKGELSELSEFLKKR